MNSEYLFEVKLKGLSELDYPAKDYLIQIIESWWNGTKGEPCGRHFDRNQDLRERIKLLSTTPTKEETSA